MIEDFLSKKIATPRRKREREATKSIHIVLNKTHIRSGWGRIKSLINKTRSSAVTAMEISEGGIIISINTKEDEEKEIIEWVSERLRLTKGMPLQSGIIDIKVGLHGGKSTEGSYTLPVGTNTHTKDIPNIPQKSETFLELVGTHRQHGVTGGLQITL